jgi:tripartite-type tricarboxylate transporter receptor subunit TctC
MRAPSPGMFFTTIVGLPGTIVGPLLDEKPDTSFDPTKVTYLGTANAGTYVCVTLNHSKTKTLKQALTQKTIMGGITAGNSVTDVAWLVKHLTGAQFDIVSGYKGTAEMMIAIERGELDGVCGWNWSSAKSQRPAWISEHKLNYLAQISIRPNPELAALGAPDIWPFIKSEDDKKVAELVVSQQIFERPYFMGPGTPPEHMATMRKAFDATMQDPQFVAEAKKVGIDVEPRPGAEVQALVQKLYSTPKPIVEQAKRAIRP